jgi:hypothetical protein
MVLTGYIWSTGRKILYKLSGRWMNEYGVLVEWSWKLKSGGKILYNLSGRFMNVNWAMVEWYWQGKIEVLGGKYYTNWVVDGWMRMEYWWNCPESWKLKYWEKNIVYCVWQIHVWECSNGGMVLTGETEVLEEKQFATWVVDEWMSMDQCWNDTDRVKLNYWEKRIIQCVWWIDEWVRSSGGMVLEGETWSTGRKILIIFVVVRWMSI